MAYEGQRIVNPRTGQTMEFVELRDEMLRVDSVHPPSEESEPLHVHPKQRSGLEVVAGSLAIEVDGRQHRLGPGESVSIPANTPHRFWTDSDEEARSIGTFEPALDIASFFETFFALAQRDELDEKGMPSTLQLAVLVPEFGDEIRPASPPWPVLRVVTAVLGPLARARGYRARLPA